MSRLREVVVEVLEQACEFGGGWNRETFDAMVGRVLAAAAARELVGAVAQEQRRGAALQEWQVLAFWRNDGKADLVLRCPGFPACPWERTSYGDPDGEANLVELMLSAMEHRREVHAS